MNLMIEMTSLFYGRPGRDAPDSAVAAWYRAKGRVHDRLAAGGGPDAAQERAFATASHEHARRLELRDASSTITAGRAA